MNSKVPNNRQSNNIKTITKAVSILKALSIGRSKLSDIAREVKISKNGVYRMLYSLKQEGMVVQNPVNREYFMGPLLFEISANPLKIHQHLINCSYLEMEDLRQATGETIIIDIQFGMEKIILKNLIGTHNVTFVGKPSPVEHLWIGAAGKVLMAQLDDRELKMILDSVTLTASTPLSITDKQTFRQEVMKAKERGYATSYGEVEIGLANIAVPIKGYVVPSSLGIVGPEDRIAPLTMDYVSTLKAKAKKISQALSESL